MTDESPADRAARNRLRWLLYAAYASMHMNRQIVAILAGPLRTDLGLGDSQLGTLTGSAFAIVFAVLGLHFGGVADRRDRLIMVRCGAILWSGAAAAAAFASGFTALLLARATVAVGEAVATAAAISLMAELSPRRHLGRTSGAFFASAYAGAGLAAIVGGVLLSWKPPLAGIAGWRSAMLAAATPGLLIALLLHDPRGGALRRRSAAPDAPRWAGVGFAASAAVVVGLQECLPPGLG
ncbi:MAG: MFS transporter, partial [Gammaproteobacteria bacterium]|nr:MFS transporter [Gammaproteobacteria bacterium]